MITNWVNRISRNGEEISVNLYNGSFLGASVTLFFFMAVANMPYLGMRTWCCQVQTDSNHCHKVFSLPYESKTSLNLHTFCECLLFFHS